MITRDELIKALIAAHIPSPRLEADIILKNTLTDYPNITAADDEKIGQILKRRTNHEPLDKIIGYREFYKSTFEVNTDVLTPRPDTEVLVESVLDYLPENMPCRILDLGTGSGCILLSLLLECPNCTGVGVDISPKALNVAQKNAQNLGLNDRVEFYNKSWTDDNFINEEFDIVVSNPPYIVSKEIDDLEREVKEFDPMLALDGGEDGLDCYRQIAKIAPLILKKGGYIFLEVGYNQAKDVEEIFILSGLQSVAIIQDLAGINRCVILKK